MFRRFSEVSQYSFYRRLYSYYCIAANQSTGVPVKANFYLANERAILSPQTLLYSGVNALMTSTGTFSLSSPHAASPWTLRANGIDACLNRHFWASSLYEKVILGDFQVIYWVGLQGVVNCFSIHQQSAIYEQEIVLSAAIYFCDNNM